MSIAGETQPLVSIVTPVYNGQPYLAECVESVLNQTYQNWEYLIVNNCSTDASLEIAERYAARDARIHVHSYDQFVGVIESSNRALLLISGCSKYCKILCADDWLFPEFLERMVALAEANPSVGVVGSYTLRDDGTNRRVEFDALDCRRKVVSGAEVCRWHLLGGRYYFGNPTSILLRADLVRKPGPFYPNLRQHADTSVFYDCLRSTDFGFVHQVLNFERVHKNAMGTAGKSLNTYDGSHLLDVAHYGPLYLTPEELKQRLELLLREYYELLATAVFNNGSDKFWDYHKAILAELGAPLDRVRLTKAVCAKTADLLSNPRRTFEKLLKRWRRK